MKSIFISMALLLTIQGNASTTRSLKCHVIEVNDRGSFDSDYEIPYKPNLVLNTLEFSVYGQKVTASAGEGFSANRSNPQMGLVCSGNVCSDTGSLILFPTHGIIGDQTTVSCTVE